MDDLCGNVCINGACVIQYSKSSTHHMYSESSTHHMHNSKPNSLEVKDMILCIMVGSGGSYPDANQYRNSCVVLGLVLMLCVVLWLVLMLCDVCSYVL